jgi:hypothetical protein
MVVNIKQAGLQAYPGFCLPNNITRYYYSIQQNILPLTGTLTVIFWSDSIPGKISKPCSRLDFGF